MSKKINEKKEVEQKEVEKKDKKINVEKKEKNNTHTHIVLIIVIVISLFLSIFNFVLNLQNRKPKEEIKNEKLVEDICYNIYIGLTDKSAKYQTMDSVIAIELIKTVCIQKNVSYTIYQAEGGYKDKEGKINTENTIILEMDHIDEEKLYEIMNDICKRLNIEKVMYSRQNKEVIYYQRK